MPTLDLSRLSSYFVSSKVEDGPYKMYFGGISPDVDEHAMIEVLLSVGYVLYEERMEIF